MSFSTPRDCLPIWRAREQRLEPDKGHSNVGKAIIGLTSQALLAMFISSPSSSPPLLRVLFGATMFISFLLSFAGIFLRNAFPKAARLFEKLGALFAAIGVSIIASFLLMHENYAWISGLACVFSLIVFGLSYN
ncbi:hypothetical protein SDJN03_23580, partial [Cucurbita argyrosperma subsp. sororia]